MRSLTHLLLFVCCAAFVLITGCSKPDRSEEIRALQLELQAELFTTPEHALLRVDSAEQVGLISVEAAAFLKTILYGQIGKARLAIFYGEQFKNHPELADQGFGYYSGVLWLCKELKRYGEWGKALQLADEVKGYLEEGNVEEQTALRVKSDLLFIKASCEKDMGHMEEAEPYYLGSLNLIMDSVPNPKDYWVIDGLAVAVVETTEFYLEWEKPEKALPLIAIGDTAIARLKRCPDMTETVYNLRRNNIIINQALNYAANGVYDKAEALYQEHRQIADPSPYDMVGEARYLAMIGRYDESIRLFNTIDSLHQAKGKDINTNYINSFMMSHYRALEKAGRKDEVIAYGDYIRHLTDSIRIQDRKIDVEQEEIIKQKEQEIKSRHQSLIIHRIILAAAFLACLFIACLLWRSHLKNKALLEKNRRLVEEIEQREKEEQQVIEQLKAEPEDQLTAEQQLFRRICDLMDSPDHIYTDMDLDRNRLAQLMGTNEHYITDAISACTNGKSVNGFLNEYRLRYATRLLANTKDSVALIAELSGFSRSSFFRIFSEAYGMSPSDYRRAASKS